MVKRILGLVGWLGAALVFIGAAIRFLYPAQEQYVPYLVWTGLAGVLMTCTTGTTTAGVSTRSMVGTTG